MDERENLPSSLTPPSPLRQKEEKNIIPTNLIVLLMKRRKKKQCIVKNLFVQRRIDIRNQSFDLAISQTLYCTKEKRIFFSFITIVKNKISRSFDERQGQGEQVQTNCLRRA